ncbi:MAG: cyclic nucleotide-binding domain-containing protein [Verrucomicrobiales bacterium]|nr:cyclic nucleotide-binding domain-containing protein [Verrucomicrobiales bacterium]
MRDLLVGVSLFSGLGSEALAILTEHARESRVPAGHLVIREGEPGRHLFILAGGAVRVFKTGHRGLCELARLREGGHFGELSLLDREERSASVEAVVDARLVLLPFIAFELVLNRYPLDYARIMENLARQLAERLRSVDDRLLAGQ